MKILWDSNAPYACTGYGQQTNLWLPRIRSLGHEVIAFAPSGHSGTIMAWEGIPVLPAWRDGFGNDIALDHYIKNGADLFFTLCDSYALNPEWVRKVNAAHWIPIDCSPLNYREKVTLSATGALPVAMSRFGEAQLKAAGFSPRYIPHGIDAAVFRPTADQMPQRNAVGCGRDTFMIGMNAFNKDVMRKAYPEQFLAFARFHQQHPDSALLVHAQVQDPQAVDLHALAKACGIADAVIFPDQYAYACGFITAENMATWYASLDLYTNAAYGEGFGITLIEAQACGVPVVVNDFSAMDQLCGSGWKISGMPFWVAAHQGWWQQPDVDEIYAAYEAAWDARENGSMPEMKQAAREFALQYDADLILHKYFKPVLEEIEEHLPPKAAEPLQAGPVPAGV